MNTAKSARKSVSMASRGNRLSRTKRPSVKTPKFRFVVSACLAGIDCTFKGKNNLSKKIKKLFESGEALAVCPEVAGGLSSPRERSEISGGGGSEVLNGSAKVLSASGKDNTFSYINGATKIAGIVKNLGIKKAILKSDSPSCGAGRIYDGTFSGKFSSRDGVFAALLKKDGVSIRTEKSVKYNMR